MRHQLVLGFTLTVAISCAGQIDRPEEATGASPTGTSSPRGERSSPAPASPGSSSGAPAPGTPLMPGSAPPVGGTPAPATATTACDPTGPPATLRRLTREQFLNVVTDLFGADSARGPRAVEPIPDGHLRGFASNLEESMQPLVLEKLLAAAEEIAAVVTPKLAAGCAGGVNGECVRGLATTLGRRAFRRPLDAREVTSLVQVFDEAQKAGLPAQQALTSTLTALLSAPQMLYVFEPGHAEGPARAFGVASRLSFFLWQSGPDDVLLDEAGGGRLRTRDELGAQVERMLRDPRARRTIRSFFRQWLELEELATLEKERTLYPEFTSTLRAAMGAETEAFVEDLTIGAGDGKLTTLLTAGYSLVPGALTALYGLPKATAAAPARTMHDPTKRRGLLTHASFLAINASPSQSSLVRRGKFVREKLLCQAPAPPPPDVDDTISKDEALSPREFSDKRLASATCGACHRLIDPLGLGFEGYDAIGRHRSKINDKPIDLRVTVTATQALDGPYDGALQLIDKLAAADEVRRCLFEQVSAFALARKDGVGACGLAQAYDGFVGGGATWKLLVREIAQSPAFRGEAQ